MHIVIWEFRAKEGLEAQFEEAYGPNGVWVQFFRRGDGFLGTELLRDDTVARRYLAIDRWTTAAAYETFRQRHFDEYQTIDRQCETLTEYEGRLGTFDVNA